MSQHKRIRIALYLTAPILALLVAFATISADEGQWPLSMVHKIDLAKAGIEIPASEIFNDKKPSLVDAICRVGGATGSFVSPDGLILTNHHVAFNAVSKASTPTHDYLHDGFVAKTRADEIVAQGYEARITVGYRDVSKDVLSAVTTTMNPTERAAAMTAKRRAILRETKAADPHLDAEVAEMFQGKNYVLFQYQLIKDVRLVIVPPRSVGEYGGENDNWIWPRHTGDFAFLRAYVGPDGKPAPFSRDNIPFTPRRFLKINAKGVSANDAVFLLGYPGRTFRHQTSAFVAFDEEVKMPFVANLLEERIRIMERISKNDRALRLKLGPRIKGMANTMKNYRGKLLGLSRLQLVAKKAAEEKQLAAWIAKKKVRQENYGHVLEKVSHIYQAMRPDTYLNYIRIRLNAASCWQVAASALAAAPHLSKPEDQRPKRFRAEGVARILDAGDARDKASFPEMLKSELVGGIRLALEQQHIIHLAPLTTWCQAMAKKYEAQEPQNLAAKIYASTRMTDKEFRKSLFDPKNKDTRDDVLDLVGILAKPSKKARSRGLEFRNELNALMPLFVDAKRQWQAADFCPDANFTLRMTFGRIRSYEPRDGVTYHPLTTLSGMVAKATGKEPYDAPKKLLDLWRNKDFGNYVDKDLNDVPVGILYDCDTTGGNSGSPVMNGKGELIGLNFDRAYEATINDYQWSEDYSRSIGVDIRYVLWITEKLMGSERVIAEVTPN